MTCPAGLLVVICGPSGVGKGSVVRRLLELLPEAARSVSVTTRPPRPDERDGVDYHFVGEERFEALRSRGALLEWATYAGHRYGTPRPWVEEQLADGRVVVLEIEVQGALQVRQRMPDALLVFVAPPSLDELERRLEERGTEDPGSRTLRLEMARQELAQKGAFDAVVVNDDLEACAQRVADTIRRARCRPVP